MYLQGKEREEHKMTKETMIRNYRKFSAADSYILGFIYNHEVYAVEVAEIMPRYMRVEHESSKKGGWGDKVYCTVADLKEIRKQINAILKEEKIKKC